MTTTRALMLVILAAVCVPLIADIESNVEVLLATLAMAFLLFCGLVLWAFTRPSKKFGIRINQLYELHQSFRDEGENGAFIVLAAEDKNGVTDESAMLVFAKENGEVGLEWSLDEASPVNVRDLDRFETFAQSMGVDLEDTRPDHGNSLRTTSSRQLQLCENVLRTFYGVTDDTTISVITHKFVPRKD